MEGSRANKMGKEQQRVFAPKQEPSPRVLGGKSQEEHVNTEVEVWSWCG